jgi:hypothetical protein
MFSYENLVCIPLLSRSPSHTFHPNNMWRGVHIMEDRMQFSPAL